MVNRQTASKAGLPILKVGYLKDTTYPLSKFKKPIITFQQSSQPPNSIQTTSRSSPSKPSKTPTNPSKCSPPPPSSPSSPQPAQP